MLIRGQWKLRLHVGQWAVENRLHVDQWAVENRLHVDQWAVENRTTGLSLCRLLMEHLTEEKKHLTVIVSCNADSLLQRGCLAVCFTGCYICPPEEAGCGALSPSYRRDVLHISLDFLLI